MPVEALLQTLLVQVVADEAHAAAEHEERVQGADVDELLRLLPVATAAKTKVRTRSCTR